MRTIANQSLNSVLNCTSIFALLLFAQFATFAQTASAQQTLPDTIPAKRFAQVLEVLNTADEKTRNGLIEKIFKKDKELNDIKAIAGKLHIQFGQVTFSQVAKSSDTEFYAVCQTKRGMEIVAGVEIAGDENLISDVTIRPHEEEEELKAVGDFFPVMVDGKSNPKCRGVWQAKGYGYVVEISDDKMVAYNYTGKFGWKIDFFDNLLFKPGDSNDVANVTFHPLEPGYNLTRLESLPEVCKKSDWKPTEIFDAFADVMTTHYPFFEVRKVDWAKRIATHRSKVADDMSEKALFGVMDSMLNELNDGHVSLQAEIDGETLNANVGHKGTTKKIFAAFEKQEKYKSPDIFLNIFMANLVDHIETKVLKSKATKECNDKLVWGRVTPDIGYIYVDSMYGYGSGGMDERVENLHAGMNKILKSLSDTKAIIIDISMNPGGTDSVSVEIARHFADQTRIGFSKWPAAEKKYRNDRKIVPYSEQSTDAVMYTKPVYLLTNDFSASAAEIFTMCMRPFPHVTTVGTPTDGVLSDILDKTLPNGWDFGISNEVYVDHEGKCHEGQGVPPDVEMQVFGDDIMKIDHESTINKVVELINERLKK